MIPRVIHRIWLGSAIPPEFERFGESWQRVNPTWTVRLWTEADLPELVNRDLWDRTPEIVPSRLVWRMRSNLARYEILWHHGGVYVDCDFEALKPLDPVIDGMTCFAAEEQPGLIANGFMGATPGHPLIRQLIDDAPESVRKRPGKPSWKTTGPAHLTRVAQARPGELSLVPTHLVYPYHHTDLLSDGSHPEPPSDAVAHHVWASRRKSVSVIIPWRAGCPHREAAREWVGERFTREHPDWQIVDADCTDEMWNKAEAIIDGARRSFGDVLVIHDADVWCSGLPEAVAKVRNGSPWAMPHRYVRRLTEQATATVLAGADYHDHLSETMEKPYRGVDGGGIVVLSRSALETVPPDRRFRGWGGEDESWAMALSTLAGPMWRGGEPLVHLWHPPQPRLSRSVGSEENLALWGEYRAANGNVQIMRRLVSGEPVRRVVTFEHTLTGRRWMAKVGTEVYDRYTKNRYLREIVGNG